MDDRQTIGGTEHPRWKWYDPRRACPVCAGAMTVGQDIHRECELAALRLFEPADTEWSTEQTHTGEFGYAADGTPRD